MVEGMKRLRAAGYRLVMHTHDEVCAEMPIGQGSVEEFERLFVAPSGWARGLPVAAKVFECDRQAVPEVVGRADVSASSPAPTTTEKETLDNGCCIHCTPNTGKASFRPAAADGIGCRVVLPRRLDPGADRSTAR
jgi:hypothetical protein